MSIRMRVGGCIGVLLCLACHGGSLPSAPKQFAIDGLPSGAEDVLDAVSKEVMGAKSGVVAAASTAGSAEERQIIYTADLRIEVKAYDAAVDRVKSIVESAGGFVADSNVAHDSGDRKSGNLVVRVPKVRFNDVLTDFKTLGTVKNEGLHGQDVTEEYTDLEARLTNARRLETRLLDLLDRESKNIKDLLETERELARVREEIERMEGRKRFLDDRLQLATITVALFEPYAYTTSVFDPLAEAFDSAGKLLMRSLAVLVTVLVVTLPWLLVLGGGAYFVIRVVRKWWRRKRGYA